MSKRREKKRGERNEERKKEGEAGERETEGEGFARHNSETGYNTINHVADDYIMTLRPCLFMLSGELTFWVVSSFRQALSIYPFGGARASLFIFKNKGGEGEGEGRKKKGSKKDKRKVRKTDRNR